MGELVQRVALESLESQNQVQEDSIERVPTVPTTPLPPTDGGKDAWLVLASCCILGILVWGMFFSGDTNKLKA